MSGFAKSGFISSKGHDSSSLRYLTNEVSPIDVVSKNTSSHTSHCLAEKARCKAAFAHRTFYSSGRQASWDSPTNNRLGTNERQRKYLSCSWARACAKMHVSRQWTSGKFRQIH